MEEYEREFGVDPARELQRAFEVQSAPVKVWKAGGVIKDGILKRLKKSEEAANRMNEIAAEAGGKISYLQGHGYFVDFENQTPLPEWSTYTSSNSDGGLFFEAPRDIEYELRQVKSDIYSAKNHGRVAQDALCFLGFPEKTSAIVTEFVMRPDDWVKSVENINGEFYVTVGASGPDLPECEQIKLSEYYRMKENLPAPAPQTMKGMQP